MRISQVFVVASKGNGGAELSVVKVISNKSVQRRKLAVQLIISKNKKFIVSVVKV